MRQGALAWVDDVAAAVVDRCGLPAVPARDIAPSQRAAVRALVLTAGSVEVLRQWRREGFEGPAVIVASDAAVVEQRASLEPVAWASRDADLRATLSRFEGVAAAPVLRLGPVEVDLESRRVSGARTERLTALEAKVLGYLAARRGRVVSKEELLAEVWGYEARNTNTVPVMVGRVRKKVEVDPTKPRWLLTCRGDGYRLVHASALPSDPGLVGRDALLKEVVERLDREGFVWLVGWPGVGRTRLAQTALMGRRSVCLDLEGVADAAGLRRVVALALGRRLADETALVDALSAFEGVLADDVDQLDDAARALLQRASPSLVAVAIQAPVGVAEEVTLHVPRLTGEAGGSLLRHAASPVALTDADASALVEGVDGLPLALELLGRSIRALGPDAALASLDGALPEPVARALEEVVARLDPGARRALVALASLPELSTSQALSLGDVAPDALERLLELGMVVAPRPGRVGVPSLVARHVRGALAPALVARVAQRVAAAVAALPTGAGRGALEALVDLGPFLRVHWHDGSPPEALAAWLPALLALDATHGSWQERRERAEQGVLWLTGSAHEGMAQWHLAQAWEARDPEETLRCARAAASGLSGAMKARALYLAARSAGRLNDWATAAALRSEARPAADAVVRLQLDAHEALQAHRSGELSDAELVDHQLAASARLRELGALGEAAGQLVFAVGTMRLGDAPRSLEAIGALSPHLDGVVAPRARLWLQIAEAELVHEVHGDLSGAMAILDAAEALALRFEPSHVAVVDGTRGTLWWDAGQLSDARRALQRNLERESHSGSDLAVLSVLLDRIGVELSAGDPDAARTWAERARRLELPRWTHYLDFEVASIELVDGAWAVGLDLLEACRDRSFNPACGISMGLRALAACRALQRDDRAWRSWLDGYVAVAAGRLARDARALLAWLDGGDDPGPLRSGLAEVDRRILGAALGLQAS